jgi:hypothetical protein
VGTQVLEGRVALARMLAVRGWIEEVGRLFSLLKDLRHGLVGKTGPLESLHDSSLAGIARRERSIVGGPKDADGMTVTRFHCCVRGLHRCRDCLQHLGRRQLGPMDERGRKQVRGEAREVAEGRIMKHMVSAITTFSVF